MRSCQTVTLLTFLIRSRGRKKDGGTGKNSLLFMCQLVHPLCCQRPPTSSPKVEKLGGRPVVTVDRYMAPCPSILFCSFFLFDCNGSCDIWPPPPSPQGPAWPTAYSILMECVWCCSASEMCLTVGSSQSIKK